MSKRKNSTTPVAGLATDEQKLAEQKGRDYFLSTFNLPGGLENLASVAQRRNLPRMFKPGDVPVGATVHGEIVRTVPSMRSDIKGKLLWLKNGELEFLFPLTGVIRQALAGQDGNDPEPGQYLFCKRLEDGVSGKYKKAMFMFDVWTTTPDKVQKLLKSS